MAEDRFDFLDAIRSESGKGGQGAAGGGGGSTCPNCGHGVSRGAAICINCGYDLKGGGQLVTTSAGGVDPTMKLIAMGGAAVVLLIVVFVVIAMTGGSGDDAPTSIAEAPAPRPSVVDTSKRPGIKAPPTTPTPTPAPAAPQPSAPAPSAAPAAPPDSTVATYVAELPSVVAAREEAERAGRELEDLRQQLMQTQARLDAQRALREQVNTSIDKGREYLLAQYDPATDRFKGKYPEHIGESALAAYALLKCGVGPQEPVIQQSLREMLQYAHASPGTDKRGTYNCGLVMLALDALREAKLKLETTSGDSAESASVRRDRLMIQGAMRKLALALSRNQYQGKSFSYGGGPSKSGHDMSIHQYAMLGMWAAYRSGVKLRADYWELQRQYLLGLQEEDGGFAYKPDRPSNPTMTTAGLGSLAICYLMLNHERYERQRSFEIPDDADRKVVDIPPGDDELAKGIDRAFAWLARSGGGGGYFVYGVERACALTRTSTINNVDWYDHHARRIVQAQAPDGSWPGNHGETCETSWNLLFLTRGTERIFETDSGYAADLTDSLLQTQINEDAAPPPDDDRNPDAGDTPPQTPTPAQANPRDPAAGAPPNEEGLANPRPGSLGDIRRRIPGALPRAGEGQ